MLNLGRLGVDGADYYLRTVASGVEEYYTGAGEAPGTWAGSESATLGLSGEVAAESLRAVLGGAHPASGQRLRPEGAGVRSDVPRAEERVAVVGTRGSVGGR